MIPHEGAEKQIYNHNSYWFSCVMINRWTFSKLARQFQDSWTCHTTPQYTTPQYTTPHHNTPHHTIPYHTTPQYTTPHHTTCTTWHHIIYTVFTVYTIIYLHSKNIIRIIKRDKRYARWCQAALIQYTKTFKHFHVINKHLKIHV